jgi:hypothetical protein
MHKYRTQELIALPLSFHKHSQQIIGQQVNKTFSSIWNWDGQEVEMKISMTEAMASFKFSEDGHFLFGGGSTGKLEFT